MALAQPIEPTLKPAQFSQGKAAQGKATHTKGNTTHSHTATTAHPVLSQVNLANRSLQNVLFLYQQAGYSLIFSSQLISARQVTQYSPAAGNPIIRLQHILAGFDLGLQKNTELNAWLIVRQPPDQHLTLTLINALNQQPISAQQRNRLQLSIDGHTINLVTPHTVHHTVQTPTASLLSSNTLPPHKQPLHRQQKKHDGQIQLATHRDFMHTLTISLKGFATIALDLNNSPREITLALQPINQPIIEETLVSASFYQLQAHRITSSNNFDSSDLHNAPTRGNDPIQAITQLPGVVNSGVSAQPNIRGGANDELLILLDGVALNEPFHLKDFQGLLSGINDQIVNTIDVYTGGYPARYGSKMSGVMDITTAEPQQQVNNRLALNTLYNALTLSDWRNDNDYYLLATRRGHLETVLQQVNPDLGTPRFNDTFAKYHWQTNEATFYEAGLYALRDDIVLFDTENNSDTPSQRVSSIYNSHYTWLKMSHTQEAFAHQWQAVYSYNKNQRQGHIDEASNPASTQGHVNDHRNSKSYRLSYNGQYHNRSEAHLAFGGVIDYTKATYRYQAQATRGKLANLLAVEPTVNINIDTQPQGFIGAVYAAYQTPFAQHWFIESGIRLEAQSFSGQLHHQLSPRLALNYALNDYWHIKSSAGRFYQAASIYGLAVSDGVSNFEPPQKSDHYILGVAYTPAPSLNINVEFYFKKIFAPKIRYENLINPYTLLPELAPDRIAITPSHAKAKGLELSINYQWQPGLTFWGAYAFSEAEDNINNTIVKRSWNQTHSLHLGVAAKRNGWQLNAQVLWRTGSPYTKLPATVHTAQAPITYSRNQQNFSDYLSIDLHLSHTWALSHSRLEAYIAITNATNQKNKGFNTLTLTPTFTPADQTLKQGTSPQKNLQSYQLQQQPQHLFPLLPTLGIEWYF